MNDQSGAVLEVRNQADSPIRADNMLTARIKSITIGMFLEPWL